MAQHRRSPAAAAFRERSLTRAPRATRWLLAVFLGSPLLGCQTHPRPEDRALFERVCSGCHPLDVPLSKNRDLKGWRQTVLAMRDRGAPLSESEAERVARYLAGVRPRD